MSGNPLDCPEAAPSSNSRSSLNSEVNMFTNCRSALNSLDLTRDPNGPEAKEILVEEDPSCRCVLYPDDSDPRWAGTCETEFSFSNRRLLEELSIKTASEMQPGIMMPAAKLNEIIKKEDEIMTKEDWMIKELAVVREDGDDLITAVNDIKTALGVLGSGGKNQRSKAAKLTKGKLVAEKGTSLIPEEVSTGEENVLDKLQNEMEAIEGEVRAVKEKMDTIGRKMDTIEHKMDTFELKMDTIEHMLVQLIAQNNN